MLGVLIKKQINERLSYFKRDLKNIDILGILLTCALIAVILYVVIEVFSLFVEKYCAVRINGVLDVLSRQRELMSIIYEFVILVGAISSVGAINHAIFDNDDKVVMATLPIKTPVIFASKLIYVYLEQCLIALCVAVPLVVVFSFETHLPASFIVGTIIMSAILPLFSIGIASIICLPYYYLKNILESKYIILLIVATAIIGVGFYFYSSILQVVENLMSTGEIKFFFDGETMEKIIFLSNNLVPACFISNAMFGIDIAKNFFISLAILVLLNLIGVFVVYMLYNKAIRNSMVPNKKMIFAPKKINGLLPQKLSLLLKEIQIVFLTPDYSVQYFSIALIMPLMIYFCFGLSSKMIESLVLINKDFELALCLVVCFSALTNTFCATNISREGKIFYLQKTMPIKASQIIGAKILLNVIVNVISIGISSTLLLAMGIVKPYEGLFIFVIGIIMGISQILVATRKDLNRPHFSQDEDNVVRETNNNVSIIVTFGLISSLILGGVPLAMGVLKGLSKIDYTWFTYTFATCFALGVLAFSLAYAFIGLKNKFNEISEDD